MCASPGPKAKHDLPYKDKVKYGGSFKICPLHNPLEYMKE
jgi:hypothetical protein